MVSYEISKWIQGLFQDDVDLPEFEKSSEAMELLSKVIALNKEADKDVNEMINTNIYLAEFYTKKSDEICKSLNYFLNKELSLGTQDLIKNISTIAIQMKLKEPSLTNFLLGQTFLESKQEEYAELQLINCFTLSQYSKKTAEVIQKNAVIERKLDSLEKIVLKQRDLKTGLTQRSKFLKVKIEEYRKRMKKQQMQLNTVGWNSSLTHSELVKKGEVVQSLEKELENITSKLNSYQNLPPNELLASLKVEEAQARFLQLQKDFQKLL